MSKQITPHEKALGSIWTSIINNIPLDVVLPIVFNEVLATIKNPANPKAQALKAVLVNFAKSIQQKFPDAFNQ